MAKQRYIQDKFWTDTYIHTLKPEQKLVFLYLLTNPQVSICGIYETTPERVKFETGSRDTLRILQKLEKDGKIIYYKNFIYLVNFLKNQNIKSEDLKKGIERERSQIPSDILSYFEERLMTLPPPSLDPPSTILNLTILNSTLPNSTQKARGSLFDKFWKEYPNKKAKAEALKAFLKTDIDINILLSALELHKKSESWQKDNGKFIPHPATWLNQRRWEDEIKPAHKIPIV